MSSAPITSALVADAADVGFKVSLCALLSIFYVLVSGEKLHADGRFGR